MRFVPILQQQPGQDVVNGWPLDKSTRTSGSKQQKDPAVSAAAAGATRPNRPDRPKAEAVEGGEGEGGLGQVGDVSFLNRECPRRF